MTNSHTIPRTIYDDTHLVSNYDQRRFGGVGGQYVFEKELNIITKFLGSVPGPILDLPCGTGLLNAHLRRAGYETIAADGSAHMLDVSRHRSENSPVVRCDAFNLPLAADSVGGSCTIRLFQHYSEVAIEQLLRELGRVVKPSGRIIFDTFRWSPRNTPLFDGGVHTYSRGEVERLLTRAGLELLTAESAFLVTPILYRKCSKRILAALDTISRRVPDWALVRTFWCCRPGGSRNL